MAKCKIERTPEGLVITYTCLCGSRVRLETYKKPDRLPVCFECAIAVEPLPPSNRCYGSHNNIKRKQNKESVHSAQKRSYETLFNNG